MSDDPYKAPKLEPERPQSVEPKRPFVSSANLWFALATFGAVPVLAAFLTDGSGEIFSLSFTWGVAQLILSIVAIRLNWGPVIPCMIIGGIWAEVTLLRATSAPTDFPRSIFIGIVGGAVVGFYFDSRRKLYQHSTEP